VERKIHCEPLGPGNKAIIVVKNTNPDMKRIAKKNNRIPWNDRRVLLMKIEILKMKSYLPITDVIMREAMHHIEKIFKTGILRGRSLEAIGAAILYWSCIKYNSCITLDEIAKYSKAERSSIGSAKKLLSKKFGYKFMPKQDYSSYFSKVNNSLKVPQPVYTRAVKIFKIYKANEIIKGDPRGWVGAAIYYACKEPNNKSIRSQGEIAKAVGITEMTIRKRTDQIMKFVKKSDISL
jgi:transcription initiation factor TFIIB